MARGIRTLKTGSANTDGNTSGGLGAG